MKILLFTLSLLISIFSSVSAAVHAADTVVLSDDLQLHLADTFLAEGEYYRAVTEYKKFRILFPASARTDYALLNMGRAYFRGDEFGAAADTFARVRETFAGSQYAPEAAYFEGVSRVRLQQPNQAGAVFEQVTARYPGSGYAPTAQIGAALLRLDRDDVSGCRSGIASFARSYPEDRRSGQADKALALLDQYQAEGQKSPVVAGVMSAIIPGSGHIYAGHPGDGITAFFLNGLFIAGTVVAIQQENYPVAGLVGVIGLPFYIGNIYGAANAATKWNVGVRKDLRGRVALLLEYRF